MGGKINETKGAEKRFVEKVKAGGLKNAFKSMGLQEATIAEIENAMEKTKKIKGANAKIEPMTDGAITRIARRLIILKKGEYTNGTKFTYPKVNFEEESFRLLEDLKTKVEQTRVLLKVRELYPDFNICGWKLKEPSVNFKEPSTCYGCEQGQNLFHLIFSWDKRRRPVYWSLPFVKFRGDRLRTVDFSLAKIFVKKGEKGVEERLAAIEQEAKEKEKKEIK